jgi:hypothetical protein
MDYVFKLAIKMRLDSFHLIGISPASPAWFDKKRFATELAAVGQWGSLRLAYAPLLIISKRTHGLSSPFALRQVALFTILQFDI